MSDDLVERLRSGVRPYDTIALAGVKHDPRCLEAADRVEADAARIRELEAEVARLSDEAQRVKPLPRINDGSGWTLPMELLEDLDREVCADGWDGCTAEVTEIISLSVERRILSALNPAPMTAGALEPVERALRHLKGCLTFPVSSEINPRGYDTRTPTPETVEYMVELVMEADATLRALTGGWENE